MVAPVRSKAASSRRKRVEGKHARTMIMQLEHIAKSFGGRQLFHDVTFRLEEYERLALVGPNGAGKTTMLNIISGQEDADEGRVLFAKGARVGYLEQEAIEMADQPIFEEVMSSQVEVLEAERRLYKLEHELGEDPTEQQLAAAGRARDAYEVLGGYTIEAKVRSVMFGLGFKEGDLRRLTTEFSGGWQMRIALAKLLIRNPEVLLLDEPTNHLDLESVKWLEGFLRGYAGTVVVVSHDRAFMDNMVDRVAEVDNGQVNLYKGNYSDYLKAREERLERLRAEAAKQAEEIAHMEAFVEKFRYKATKSKQVQDRVKKLEKIKRIELPEEIKSAMSEIDITPAVLSHGNKLMQLTLPDHTLAVMVKREGRYFIPKGNTELKENDKLLMISDNDEALLQAYDSLGVKDYTMKKN